MTINCFGRQDAYCQLWLRFIVRNLLQKNRMVSRESWALHHPARFSISRPMLGSYTPSKKGTAEEVGFFGASLCFTAHKQELGAFRGE